MSIFFIFFRWLFSVWFDFYQKSNQTEIFFFEKKTETGSNRPVSVRFGFFRAKTGLLGFSGFGSVFSVLARFFPGLARIFSVWLGFFGLALFWLGFSGLARFFSGFLSVSVRFFAYKTEPAGFFKNLIGLIGFFFCSVFSVIFFSDFLDFPVFLLTPTFFFFNSLRDD